VIKAWVCGRLVASDAYTMPGCRKVRGRQRPDTDIMNIGESKMDGRKGRKKGAGRGAGNGGQSGKGQGRGQGSRSAGAGPGMESTLGTCVCPACGYSESHTRGVPCASKKCPTCGIVLTRK
jgi:hypothetical protein